MHGLVYSSSRVPQVTPSGNNGGVKIERNKNPHGQYFTPRNVADLMLDLLHSPKSAPVLEPCSGAGVFLDALTARGYENISALEIDPNLANHSSVQVLNQSFVVYENNERFSAVIGNPPYIRWKDLSEDSRGEMIAHKLYGSLFNTLSDYLTVFIAGSIELLEDGGELVFITPSFWMHTQHSSPLRDWLLDRGSITKIVDFGETTVFNKVASAIIIFKFVKGTPPAEKIQLVRYVGPSRIKELIFDLDDATMFEHVEVNNFQPGKHWTLATADELEVPDALERDCSEPTNNLFGEPIIKTLGQSVDIANGMVSGLDKAFRIPDEIFGVLTEEEKGAALPVIKAFNMRNLVSTGTTSYIDIPIGLSEDEVKLNYPNFYSHLEAFRGDLEKRYSYNRELPFWEWSFRRSQAFFLSEVRKGFVPCKERLTNRDRARFTMTPSWAVATQDVTGFAPKYGVPESIEYIVAYLNQPAVTSWIRRRGLMKGGIAEFSERPLSSLPFRKIDWQNDDEIQIHSQITNLMKELSSGASKSEVVEELIALQFAKLLPRTFLALEDGPVLLQA